MRSWNQDLNDFFYQLLARIGQCRPDLTVRLPSIESMLQTVVNQVVGMKGMNKGSLVLCTMKKVAFPGIDAGRRNC